MSAQPWPNIDPADWSCDQPEEPIDPAQFHADALLEVAARNLEIRKRKMARATHDLAQAQLAAIKAMEECRVAVDIAESAAWAVVEARGATSDKWAV